jgi:hypothetical protein
MAGGAEGINNKNIMNKTELLADIETKVLKVVKTTEESDVDKNAANVKSYVTNVMEQDGETVKGRNIGWYTIDEGQPTEAAFYRDIVTVKKDFHTKFTNYLNGLVPATYIRAKLDDVDEVDRSGHGTVVKDNGNGTATEVKVFLYRDSVAKEQTHIELT